MPRPVQILDQDTQQLLVEIDAALSYVIAGDAEVTDHPVEQGANVTDHIRPKPRTLAIEGMVSNTPVNPAQGSEFLPDEPGAAEAVYSMLENRRIGGFLHTIVTRLDSFSNMALVSVSEPRSAQVGDSLLFSLSFKEIRVVQNQAILVQTANPQGQPKTSQGKKTPAPANPPADNRTVAAQVFDFFSR